MSLLVVTYLFLGGTGAGTFLVLIVLDLLSPEATMTVAERSGLRTERTKRYRPQAAYLSFFFPCFAVCCATMAMGALCLSFDLGRPDRLLFLFFNPTPSYLTLGTYALSVAIICAGFLTAAWSGLGPQKGWPRWLVRFMECVGLVGAGGVMLYTGLLLYSIGTGTLLESPLIPLLFVLSALSCGIALIFAATAITGSLALFRTTMQRLTRIDSVLLGLELLALVLLILMASLGNNPPVSSAAEGLLWGTQAAVFWLALVAGGLLLPLALENIRALPLQSGALVIACAALVGGFALRWSLVEVGLSTAIVGA